jgi:N6-L-threonylcarbamoyladenine synthase
MTQYILAIETSCDETAIAIVDSNKKIINQQLISQTQEHQPFGGVVPEIAARAHLHYLPNLINQCLKESNLALSAVDAIAATGGPGLIGGVMVGVMIAKGLAYSLNKPFIAVNHLEGHALTIRLTHSIEFPYLLLLVSGGHCQFLLIKSLGNYQQLGATRDDALGEAFDKIAKMMGLPYPGGPIIETLAKQGNPLRFSLPTSMIATAGCDFSFSGIKSAVKRLIDGLTSPLSIEDKCDISASFQHIAIKILQDRFDHALHMAREIESDIKQCVIAGGVAANNHIRLSLEQHLLTQNATLLAPPIPLCTDNAAMIGWAAMEYWLNGKQTEFSFIPKARWPLSTIKNS